MTPEILNHLSDLSKVRLDSEGDSMSERIWISSEVVDVAGFDLPDHDDPTEVEYIRADIHEASLATARREARDAALEEAARVAVEAGSSGMSTWDDGHCNGATAAADAILALRTRAPT